jgi:hypothetical protein
MVVKTICNHPLMYTKIALGTFIIYYVDKGRVLEEKACTTSLKGIRITKIIRINVP